MGAVERRFVERNGSMFKKVLQQLQLLVEVVKDGLQTGRSSLLGDPIVLRPVQAKPKVGKVVRVLEPVHRTRSKIGKITRVLAPVGPKAPIRLQPVRARHPAS